MRGIEACRAGRIAAAFVVLVAAAVSLGRALIDDDGRGDWDDPDSHGIQCGRCRSRASTAPLAVHSAEAASLITGMMACDHTSLEWWQLLGVTETRLPSVQTLKQAHDVRNYPRQVNSLILTIRSKDRQMQYVVAQMEPIPFLRSSINLPAYLGEAFNWSTASLDIGAGGACGERAVK